MVILGLKTCDTCRKARQMLDAAGQDARLRDLRDEPLTGAELARLWQAFGPDLVNRRSTTWRGLDDAARAGDPQALLAAHPALMKRPVIVAKERLWLGWGADVRAALLGSGAENP